MLAVYQIERTKQKIKSGYLAFVSIIYQLSKSPLIPYNYLIIEFEIVITAMINWGQTSLRLHICQIWLLSRIFNKLDWIVWFLGDLSQKMLIYNQPFSWNKLIECWWWWWWWRQQRFHYLISFNLNIQTNT